MRQTARRGFTLVELLVAISIIGILMALLFPALNSIRSNARTVQCQSNLSQIGKAVGSFLTRTDIKKLDPKNWVALLQPELSGQQSIFTCPELSTAATTGYGINNLCSSFGAGNSRKIFVLDFKNSIAQVVGPELPDVDRARNWDAGKVSRHAGQINVLYFDGHVNTRTDDEIDPVSKEIHDELWMPYLHRYERAVTYVDIFGLKGEYFYGRRTWDTPAITRIEVDLNLPFGGGSLSGLGDPQKHPFNADLANGGFYTGLHSSRFTGQIRSDYSENYTFRVSHDDSLWITINGNNFYSGNSWTGTASSSTTTTSIPMVAGQWVDIEVKHSNDVQGGTHMWMKWSSPSTPEQSIPNKNLRLKPN